MKYIIYKNINLIKEKILKYFLLQILFLLIILFIDKSVIQYLNNYDTLNYLGIMNIINCSNIEKLIKIMNYIIIFYVTFKIYLFDILNSAEYLVLRKNYKKIILYNIFINTILIILMRLILFVILILFVKSNSLNFNVIFFIKIFIKDIIFFNILSLFCLIIININSLGKNIIYNIIIAPIIFLTLFIDLYKISYVLLIIIYMVLFIISIKLSKFTKIYNYYRRK